MAAAACMIRGNVSQLPYMLQQAAEATNVPEVATFWLDAYQDLVARYYARGILYRGSAEPRGAYGAYDGVSILIRSYRFWSQPEMRAQAASTKNSLIVWLAFDSDGSLFARGIRIGDFSPWVSDELQYGYDDE